MPPQQASDSKLAPPERVQSCQGATRGTEATRARRKRRRRARSQKGHYRKPDRSCPNNRRTRRAQDPEVKARREAWWAQAYPEQAQPSPTPSSAPAATAQLAQLQAPEVSQRQGVTRGKEGKRTYSIEQMLALRPRPTSQLCPAAPLFVPYALRYSCFARAVRLGVADPPKSPVWQRPRLSAVAQQLCSFVHALLL